MTNDSTKQTPATPARTDDLLAGGAEPQDGARGFDGKAHPGSLQTGMEGIAGTTARNEKNQTGSRKSGVPETLQDNPGQVRDKQG